MIYAGAYYNKNDWLIFRDVTSII